MKSGCIRHPAGDPALVIHRWQLLFCDGDHCAAVLLSFFEREYEKALEVGDRSLLVGKPYTEKELEDGILHFYSRKLIRKAIRLLEEKGAISVRRNPDPRLRFDRTRYFVYHPEVVERWLNTVYASRTEEDGNSKKPASE